VEHCQICGKKYSTVYELPDEIWKKITPKSGESGLLCMECAEKRAEKLGIDLFWRAKEGEYAKASNITKKLKSALEVRKAKVFKKNCKLLIWR